MPAISTECQYRNFEGFEIEFELRRYNASKRIFTIQIMRAYTFLE